jgi:hypothetical protein
MTSRHAARRNGRRPLPLSSEYLGSSQFLQFPFREGRQNIDQGKELRPRSLLCYVTHAYISIPSEPVKESLRRSSESSAQAKRHIIASTQSVTKLPTIDGGLSIIQILGSSHKVGLAG